MGAGDLIQSFTIDPANIAQGGVGADSRLVLIQKTDYTIYTANGIDQITAITLAANKSGFSFDGVRQSLKPKYERVSGAAGQSLYKHGLEFLYFAYDQVAKNNAMRMSNGRYVAIYENSKIDGNTFEVMGIDVGLEVVEHSRAPQELGGAIRIVMSSPENEYEVKPPRTFDAGTGVYATNRTAVDAFLFLPTIGVGGLSIVTYPAVTPTAIVITGTNFFGNDANSAVLGVALVNNLTGSVIPFIAALAVTNTTITTTTPATGEGSGKNYKVRVTTKKGVVFSAQNIITT